MPPAADTSTVADLIGLFWRRKMLFIGIVVLVTGLAALAAFQIPPKYTALERLMIHPVKEGGTANLVGLPLGLMRDARAGLYGEIEVITSDRLVEKVARELKISEDPEFNSMREPERLGGLDEIAPLEWINRQLGIDRPSNSKTAASRSREMAIALSTFRDQLVVRPAGLSNVVSIEFTSGDPDKAARVANTFGRLYISDRMERRVHANFQAREWLDKRLSELRETMIRSERAVGEFQASRRLTESGRVTVADQQVAEANRQLMQAKAEKAEKNVRYQQVLKMMRSEEGLSSVKEVRESRLVQQLRQQESTIIRRAAELETRFGERHPKMINVRAELANVRSRLAEEELRIVEELKNEVRVSDARVAALELELERVDGARLSVQRDKVQLNQLQRESDANRRLYENFLARSKQSKQRETLRYNDVEVISPAKPPQAPSAPRKRLIISFGFLASLALGVFAVLLLERLDNGFRTAAQIERMFNCNALGMVPRRQRKQGHRLSNLVVQETNTPYVEAIRSLRTSISLSNLDDPPKIILVASALPGEGKTSLAASLARLAASSALEGRSILIDCDLRNPAIAREIGIKAGQGLIDLFSGQAKLEDIVVTDPETGLHVIPAPRGTPNPSELLNSSHMRALLAALSQSYDTIILDSPALTAVSDARVLARLADATVFVVQWGATPRYLAIDAYKQLLTAGARIGGVVLQKVNLTRSQYYYYYYPYKEASS